MNPCIRFVITDISMGLGHFGLNEVIREHKKKNKLFAKILNTEGGLVLFVNRPRNACKLFSENGTVIGYLRTPGKITASSIDRIPATFGGSVEYSSAVKNALSKLVVSDNEPSNFLRGTLTA